MEANMSVGQFVFMLHSHLPYYRKAGMWPFGEENLYECMAETYVPLLNAISELYDEGIKAKLTVGITPILAEQLNDEHLQNGFVKYIDAQITAVSKDLERYPDPKVAHSQHLKYLAKYYFDLWNKLRDDFVNKYEKNLIKYFKKYQDLGCIEITTSGATHGFSPRNRDVSVEYDLMIHDLDLLCFFVDKNAMMYKSFHCEELSEDRVHAFYDLRTLTVEFIADRNCASDSRMVEISMNGRSVTLDLGAYRNGNPAYALQKEHQAFLNYLNSYKNTAKDPEYDWYGSIYDACQAVIMVSLIDEVYKKGRANETDAK